MKCPVAVSIKQCSNYYMKNTEQDIKKFIEHNRSLPANRRLDALISHKDSLNIVRSLKAFDLLQILREVGAEDSLELIELLSGSQVQELLDLEIWRRDNIDLKKAGRYFSLLFEANPESAVSQIHELDIELIGLMLKSLCRIYDTSLEEEPEDYSDIVSLSPDGRFIVCFKSDPEHEALSEALKSYLDAMYGRDARLILNTLEKVRFELASELEEGSYRWRNGRLLDLGILPLDERLEYFSPLLKKAQLPKLTKALPSDHNLGESFLCASTVHKDLDKFYFLKSAINAQSPDEQAALLEHLIFASINMHALLSEDFGDNESINQTTSYVKALANFGIASLSSGDNNIIQNIFLSHSMKDTIRSGRGTLIALRKRLNKNPGFVGKDFIYLDSPLREFAQCLSLSEPRFYDGLIDERKFSIRFFATFTDLDAALKAIAEIHFRAELCSPQVLGFAESELKEPLAHATLYARSLINSYLGEEKSLKNILERDWSKLFKISGGLKEEFVSHAQNFAKLKAEALIKNNTYNSEEYHEKTYNFSSSILIQLEKNAGLLLG
jgi:hypothetical protein